MTLHSLYVNPTLFYIRSLDFGILKGPGTHPQWIPKDYVRFIGTDLLWRMTQEVVLEAKKAHNRLQTSGRLREVSCIIPLWVWKSRTSDVEDGRPSSRKKKKENSVSLTFCSVEALHRSNHAHPYWWGCSSLLSLWIQMLLSSRNILVHTLRNNVAPTTWACLSPVDK
jgi:hypothetical protein